MDIDNMWKLFLEKIEKQTEPIAYEIWFMETKLVSLSNECAKILVPMSVHKKHLKENYNDLIEKVFAEVTGTYFKMEYITEEEFEKNITIDVDEVGVPALEKYESNLDSHYTFDNFISGDSNKFAKAIALAVAEKPGSMYNPLFIYGSSGLGKTHLMHAIGNYIVQNSKKRVLYVASDKFVNDFLQICQKNKDGSNFDKVNKFKAKYRDIDVLMVDDIQYLEIASTTQQEFFSTFNDLHSNNKQIVIASDRSPDDLKKLEENLRTRFNGGITVNILPPKFELRMAIIDKKIESQDIGSIVPQEVKEYIANNCTSDIRKLEGALTRILAYATIMNGSEITLDLAIEALKDYFSHNIVAKNKVDQVQQIVAKHYNISVDDLKGKKRNANIAIPRQVAMYICRVYIEETLPKIGSAFGGKDHTTVMHSVDKITKAIKNDKDLESDIQKIISQIG